MIDEPSNPSTQHPNRLEEILLENRRLMKSIGNKIIFWLIVIAGLLAVILHFVTR